MENGANSLGTLKSEKISNHGTQSEIVEGVKERICEIVYVTLIGETEDKNTGEFIPLNGPSYP
jgi:hypothetical protein